MQDCAWDYRGLTLGNTHNESMNAPHKSYDTAVYLRSKTDLRHCCCCQWEGVGEGVPLWRSLPLTLTLMCQLPQMIMKGWTLKKKKKVLVQVPLPMKYRWQLHTCVSIQEAFGTETAKCNACTYDQHISQQSCLCVHVHCTITSRTV